jgi:3-oxoacyl-[acyl-carrier-protein] synthase I
MYEVAITGIGIVSCIGLNKSEVTESLKKGKSGIVFSKERQELGFRGCLTGIINNFSPPELDRRSRKTMTEFNIWAYDASLQAIKMAGWQDSDIKNIKTGLIFGNDSSTIAAIESYEIMKEKKSTLNIGGNRVFMALNSTISMNLNTLFGNEGISLTISAACASGGHSIGIASDLIALGKQDRILCGGAQEITWESVCSFDATNAFSCKTDNPEFASRPFDKDRDGLIPSGGSAAIALERMDLAKKRGANILGKISAYNFSSNGNSLSLPSGIGLRKCIEGCISYAGINKGDIDYISAHATSTLKGDSEEAKAIYEVFGTECPHVSSTKSMTGHEMWMSGASQIVYSTIMNLEGFIAPNINFVKQENESPEINITNSIIDKKPSVILTNSAGFGGTNSCLLLDYRI